MKTKNTNPEIKIRSILFSKGYRFKVHDKKLPGKPDIVLPKHKVVINVNGCFWHYHGCGKCNIPKSKTKYWLNRFEINKKRDKLHKSRVWLTRYAKPLDVAIADQLSLDFDGPEDCDSGYCFT